MTIDETRLARQGYNYWSQYVYLNGYSWEPKEEGLKKLSRNIDINIPWLKKCINLYLEA